MDLRLLSKSYTVRKLDEADVDAIFELMRKNEIFYKYHPPFVTKESILEDMKALPPQKSYEDKYYIGFFEDKTLVANMDLILSYPTEHIAFIGFFMTDVQYQNKGIGSKIIREVCACLKSLGYLCENGIDFVGTIIRTRQNALCFDFDAAVAALFAWVDGENVETDETKTPEYQMLCKIYRLTKPGLGIPSAAFSDDAAAHFYEQWDALKRAPQTDAKGENRPLRRAARPLCRALPAASGRVLSDARGRRREFLRRKQAELYPGLGRSHLRAP